MVDGLETKTMVFDFVELMDHTSKGGEIAFLKFTQMRK